MTKDEALKLALEALEYRGVGSWRKKQPAITAIKEALAQPEQELVTWVAPTIRVTYEQLKEMYPPQRKPLTDEEIDKIWGSHTFIQATDRRQQAFARAIEAAHGIKE